jgi:hypothetical protein
MTGAIDETKEKAKSGKSGSQDASESESKTGAQADHAANTHES